MAAHIGFFHDAKPSNMQSPHRFSEPRERLRYSAQKASAANMRLIDFAARLVPQDHITSAGRPLIRG